MCALTKDQTRNLDVFGWCSTLIFVVLFLLLTLGLVLLYLVTLRCKVRLLIWQHSFWFPKDNAKAQVCGLSLAHRVRLTVSVYLLNIFQSSCLLPSGVCTGNQPLDGSVCGALEESLGQLGWPYGQGTPVAVGQVSWWIYSTVSRIHNSWISC